MAREKGQAANMRPQVWTDQHGRPWFSIVNKRDDSQAPASPPTAEGWTAPYAPGPEYLRMPPGDHRTYGRLEVDYERWLGDVHQSWEDRTARLDGYARAYAQSDDTLYAQLVAHPSAAILAALGPAPLHPNYVKACMAGDRWALGFTDEMPAWARKLWPDGFTDPRRTTYTVDLSFLEEDEAPAPVAAPPAKRRGRPPKASTAALVTEGASTE